MRRMFFLLVAGTMQITFLVGTTWAQDAEVSWTTSTTWARPAGRRATTGWAAASSTRRTSALT